MQKKNDIKTAITNLFKAEKELRLPDIANAIELSGSNPKNRRAIQRVLAQLIEDKIIEPKGQARARSYILKDAASSLLQRIRECLKRFLFLMSLSCFSIIFRNLFKQGNLLVTKKIF